jgi:hypothetical protein
MLSVPADLHSSDDFGLQGLAGGQFVVFLLAARKASFSGRTGPSMAITDTRLLRMIDLAGTFSCWPSKEHRSRPVKASIGSVC